MIWCALCGLLNVLLACVLALCFRDSLARETKSLFLWSNISTKKIQLFVDIFAHIFVQLFSSRQRSPEETHMKSHKKPAQKPTRRTTNRAHAHPYMGPNEAPERLSLVPP